MTVLRRNASLLILALVIVVTMLCGLIRPSLYSTAFTISLYSLIALPLGLMYGQGGTISLAQGAFSALGAYATAIATTRYGLHPVFSLLLSISVPFLLAFAISRPILRLPELSLALVTLSLGTVVEVALQRGGTFTNNFIGISGIPPLPLIGRSPVLLFLSISLILLLAVFAYTQFIDSARGRALNAIRTDRLLAETSGVSVASDLALLFSIAAGVAGLAGWFYAHAIGFVAPDSFSVSLSANILFMVVLGGRKAVLGPILGAAFFTLANDILPGVETQGLVFGVLLAAILLLSPDGLLSPRALRWLSQSKPGTCAKAKPQRVYTVEKNVT